MCTLCILLMLLRSISNVATCVRGIVVAETCGVMLGDIRECSFLSL